MLVVMDFHRAGVDVGLQGVVGVRQVGYGICHGLSPFFSGLIQNLQHTALQVG